jgi:quercetin dioxygenase-like cupin family protein
MADAIRTAPRKDRVLCGPAIKKGATLCGHEVDGPITLQVLSGAVQFGVAGEPRTLAAGTLIALDKAIPHDIQALEDSELLLTIVREIK